MAFECYSVTTSAGSEKKSDVNWDELNQHIIDTAGLQERETLVGYVSAIVDLGIQKQEDAEYVFEGDADDEAEEIEKDGRVYFKDGINQETKKPARMKCLPQKDQQAIAIAVDFPDIMVDKGQFFGESNPKPLRLWMGGQFYTQNNGMILGRPTALKVTNLDKERKTKKWSLAQNHVLYKMAVAAKLIKPSECFLPNDIDKILGQAFQFSAQVYMKEGKGGKSYFTEYINFVGALGRGQATPELVTTPILIQFNKKNPDEAVAELRNHVINTMKMATNWEGSMIQKQVEANKNQENQGETEAEPSKEEPVKETKPKKVSKPKVETPVVEDIEDDDLLPF